MERQIGTLSVSSFRGFLGTSDEHFLMVIGSGIGAFAGVTGELFFDGEFIFGAQGGDTFEGSMSGTLVFPP